VFARGWTWRARAVPIPWAARPTAQLPARQSRRPKAFSSGVTRIALVLPAAMTTTAVSSGTPPISRATPIAIGAVKDFGATQAISAASGACAKRVPAGPGGYLRLAAYGVTMASKRKRMPFLR
jgi:hypothetical protein